MRRPAFSLEVRLVVRLCLVFAAFFMISGLFIFWHYRAGNELSPVEGLTRDFRRLEKDLVIDPKSGGLTMALSDPNIDFVIKDRTGKVLLAQGSIAINLTPISAAAALNSVVVWEPVPQQGQGEVVSFLAPIQRNNQIYDLRVARLITPEQSGADTFFYEWVGEFLPASLPLFGLLIIALIFTLRAAMQPLTSILRYANAIGPARIDLRLPVKGLPRELVGFVEAVNDAFNRLERGFRSQQDFLADAAHELRTPLAILSAHLDTLPDKAEAKTLRADVDRMNRLVEQLLLVARMEALNVRQDDITNLSDIAMELVQLLAPIAIKNKRRLALTGANQTILVRGNRDALYQALRNLIENALRFTSEDSEVEIIVDPLGSITVADRGPGIPEEDRDKLFQRFWQSDHKQGSGAGLGLTIAQRIALAHKGTLAVSDNPGGGARFTLKLPLAA